MTYTWEEQTKNTSLDVSLYVTLTFSSAIRLKFVPIWTQMWIKHKHEKGSQKNSPDWCTKLCESGCTIHHHILWNTLLRMSNTAGNKNVPVYKQPFVHIIQPTHVSLLITFRSPYTSGTELWLNYLSSSELDCMLLPTLILFCAADMVGQSTWVQVCMSGKQKHRMWGQAYSLTQEICLPSLFTHC
jgi:hypothetical protein